MSFYARSTGIFGGGGGGGGTAPLADIETIAAAATTVSAVFGTAFAADPVVVFSLGSTDVGADQLSIIESTISTAGFTVTLSAPTPTANYYLNWVASSVNN